MSGRMHAIPAAAPCNTCRYWSEDMTVRAPDDQDWGWGECRRTPPTIIPCIVAAAMPPSRYGQQVDLDVDTIEIANASRWPVTFATDGCGQFDRLGEELSIA